MFCWAFSLTAILGTVRCIVIHYPFYRINKVLVLGITVGTAIFTVGLGIAMYFEDDEHIWSSYTVQVFAKNFTTEPGIPVTFILAITKATGNMFVSLTSAALSVWGLKRADTFKKTKETERKRGGKEAAMTIAYLNILIGLQFILLMMVVVVLLKFRQNIPLMNYVFFFTMPFSNTLISAVNPLIYIVRCKKIRQGVKRTPSQISKVSLSGNTTL